MTKEELYAHPGWEWCTFEGARKQTLLLGLQTTFREKIEWLEEAETFSLKVSSQSENCECEEARVRDQMSASFKFAIRKPKFAIL